ncbi:MAG: hypothetical protein J5903_04260 [Clostridia bacterium]|nr:hypothetical protein [Clostridia bacterium]
MFFLIDGVLIALLICVFWFGIKKGITGNWVFSIIKTVIALAGGGGAAAGMYFLMNGFGWLDVLSDGVVGFFGNITNNVDGLLTQANFVMVCKIIAFIPFAIFAFILGYVLVFWLVGLLFKVIHTPFEKLRQWRLWRFFDNLLGSIFNLAILGGVVLAIFGAIHGINQGEKYKNVLGNAKVVQPFNESIEIVLNGMHENLSAGPLCGLIYEYNPLNDMFASMF